MRFDQKEWWACGHAAMASLLKAHGINPPTLAEAIQLLNKIGARSVVGQGMSILHIGAIASLWARVRVRVYISKASMDEVRGNIICSEADIVWKRGAEMALKVLTGSGSQVITTSVGLDTFFSTHGVVPLVLRVRCAAYYQFEAFGDEDHFLGLVPCGTQMLICDPYEMHGYLEIEDWPLRLEAAAKFNWAKWTGDILSIAKHDSSAFTTELHINSPELKV